MRNNSTFTGVVLLLCTLATFVVPFLSWLLSALGAEVNSILSDEGWRWVFRSGIQNSFSYPVAILFCFITAKGCYDYADIQLHQLSLSQKIKWACAGLLLQVPVLVAALHPRSPLVSLTGGLAHSPLLYGLPFVLCLQFILALFVCVLFTKKDFGFRQIGSFLVHGISAYGAWIYIGAMLSFVWHCLAYMLNGSAT